MFTKTPLSATRVQVLAQTVPSAPSVPPTNTWTERLTKLSTFASILCAIDCTVFPVLLLALPLVGVTGISSALVHRIAHACALYFVLPVGGAALLANFAQHRRPLVAMWGLSGLLLVLLSNAHLPFLLPIIERVVHSAHELINVAGCGLLLSSQWYSHRVLHQEGKCCGHGQHEHQDQPDGTA